MPAPLVVATLSALLAASAGCGGNAPSKEGGDGVQLAASQSSKGGASGYGGASGRAAGGDGAGGGGGDSPTFVAVPGLNQEAANAPKLPPPLCVNFKRGVLGAVADTQIATNPDGIHANGNFGATLAVNVGQIGPGRRYPLLRFDLSGGALPPNLGVTSATMTMTARLANSGTLTLFAVSPEPTPWDEMTVNYTNFYQNPAPQYGPPIATAASVLGPISWDITSTVQAWATGTENNGVTMDQDGFYFTNFFTSEDPSPSLRPNLKVCYIPDLCAGVTCTALDQCHAVGVCDQNTGICSQPEKPNGSSCNDNDSCSQTDTCQAGTCIGANPVVCALPDQCHTPGTCDTLTGICSNPMKANGTACNDANACTQSDTCQVGVCQGDNPVLCAAPDQCHDTATCNTGTGVCEFPNKANGTACDDVNVCTLSDACQSGTCVGANAPNGFVCRAAVGGCDFPETCDGSNAQCPADVNQPLGFICRGAAGICDAVETCDGASKQCPTDTFKPSSTVCRAVGGVCDVAESCTGSSSACPGDTFLTSATVCRAAVAGGCDVAENCTGASNSCPSDTVVAAGTVCRISAGICDLTETCNGTANTCPTNAFVSSATPCRVAVAGGCDITENCTGSAAACPGDAVVPAGTICRNAAGVCDVTETCNGTNACPGDAKVAGGTSCRGSAGVCDVQENCDGSSVNCPTDVFLSAATVCRPAVGGGLCDNAENCTGSAAACPVDSVKSSATVCRAAVGGGACDIAENCTGSSNTCPGDAVKAVNTVCRAVAGICDIQEVCNGSSNTCPGDSFFQTNTICRGSIDPSGGCDPQEVCPGNSASCPGDTRLPNNTACFPFPNANDTCQNGVCTVISCNGCNGDYDASEPNGCECAQNTNGGGACANYSVPTGAPGTGTTLHGLPDLGTVQPNAPATVSGNAAGMPTARDTWYMVQFAGVNTAGYRPRVRLTTNPGSQFVLDVNVNGVCGTTDSCLSEGGVSTGKTDWEKNNLGANTNDAPTRVNLPDVGRVYFRVYRKAGPTPTCENWTVTMSAN